MEIKLKKYFWTAYLVVAVAFGAFCFNVIAGPSVTGGGGGGGSALSEEQVEDFVGGMLGGTETGLSVTYVDSTNDIDFVLHASLQSILGLTEADVTVIAQTGADAYEVVTSGGNYYMLTSDDDNDELAFVAPATVLTQIGAEGDLSNEAGLYAALSDVANFLQDNEGFTGQVTVQEFVEDDLTPDVSLAALMTNNVYFTNGANPITITDFDDADDHSEFGDGDWFILRVDDANTTIDFSGNTNIEGNAGVDFTGSATQIVYLLFIYEDARWNAVNFTSGFSSPTVFAPSAINMNSGLISQECCESFTIIEPDLARAASDDIKLKKFCAEAYPYGVTVTAIHIETDGTDITDTFLFEQWDDADGGNQVTLESIAISATDTGEDDGDMSSTDIPADYFFSVNLDDTSDDYKLVIITLCYTIDPS